MNQLEEKPISISEVKKLLKEQEKDYKESERELLYEQKRAKDHCSHFAVLTQKQAQDLTSKLLKLDIGLAPERAVKIVDLLPETIDDVRAVFAKERFKYGEDEIKQITDLVAQYK